MGTCKRNSTKESHHTTALKSVPMVASSHTIILKTHSMPNMSAKSHVLSNSSFNCNRCFIMTEGMNFPSTSDKWFHFWKRKERKERKKKSYIVNFSTACQLKCLAVNVLLKYVRLKIGNYMISYMIGILPNRRNCRMQSSKDYDPL
jgi:hypothetical protein